MSRLLTGFAFAVGLLVSPAAGRAADNDPKDIIAKAIKAHGGEEFLTKNKASQTKNKGKITLPNVGEVDFEQETAAMLPDKFKDNLEITINGQKLTISTLINGDQTSVELNGKEVDAGGDKIKEAMKDASYKVKLARLTGLLNEKEFQLSAVGEDKVEGKPVVGVRVSSKGHKDVNLYFDKATGLLAKFEHQTTDLTVDKEITLEQIITEYEKNADGILRPKKVTIKRDGKTFMEFEVVEAKLLEKLDDSEFKK